MLTINKTRIARLEMLIKEHGGLKLFSEKIGRSESQIYQWLKESPDFKTGKPRAISNASARRIEYVCGKHIGWMDQPINKNVENNVEVIQIRGKKVPLISWVQAGEWCEAIDNFAVGDAEEWMLCPVKHSDKTYVLRVRGLSMFNPEGDLSFRYGEYIYVDPNIAPRHKSLVIAKLADTNEVTFKQLIIEGERRYLYALNPNWKDRIIEISGNTIICGVIIFSGNKY